MAAAAAAAGAATRLGGWGNLSRTSMHAGLSSFISLKLMNYDQFFVLL
jgi:hypothetical protein